MKFPAIFTLVLLSLPAMAQDEEKIDCANTQVQFAMNICANKDYQAADRKLNDVYKKVFAAQEGDTANLKAAQRAWIAFRDAQCKLEAAPEEGGSIYPLIYANCLTRVTEARSKELNGLIK